MCRVAHGRACTTKGDTCGVSVAYSRAACTYASGVSRTSLVVCSVVAHTALVVWCAMLSRAVVRVEPPSTDITRWYAEVGLDERVLAIEHLLL